MNTKIAEIKPVDQLRVTLNALESEFVSALPAEIPADKFVRVIMTAVQMNPDLITADRKSLIASCMKAAQDGLLLDGREAALIMFKKQAQYMPMVIGLYKKMRGKAGVDSVAARVVYANDKFSYVLGDSERIEHIPEIGKDSGAIIGAYAIAKLSNGEIEREFMPVHEIDEVKAVSKSGNNGPWGKWYGEMAKKTVIKRLAKRLPVIDGLGTVIAHDDEDYDLAMASSRAKDITGPRPTQQDFVETIQSTPVYMFVEETGEPTGECTSPTEYVEWLIAAMTVDGVDFHALWDSNAVSIAMLEDETDEGFIQAATGCYSNLRGAEDAANKKANQKTKPKNSAKAKAKPADQSNNDQKNNGGALSSEQSDGDASAPVSGESSAPDAADIDWDIVAADILADLAKCTDTSEFAQIHAGSINDMRAAGMSKKATDIQTAIFDKGKELDKDARNGG